MGFQNQLLDYSPLNSINVNQLIVRAIVSLAIILVGIFLGKIVNFGLKKLSQKLELNKKIRGSFIELFLVVIKWSIYIIFISIGLNKLEIPTLTNFFTGILITIPAFTGALVLLAIGFIIAIYLRDVIEDAEVTGWDLISKVVFYFVLFLFGVYALKTALISFNENTSNLIIIILTAVISSSLAYIFVKKEMKRSYQEGK